MPVPKPHKTHRGILVENKRVPESMFTLKECSVLIEGVLVLNRTFINSGNLVNHSVSYTYSPNLVPYKRASLLTLPIFSMCRFFRLRHHLLTTQLNYIHS